MNYKNVIIFGSNLTYKEELTKKITQELPYQELKTNIVFDDFKGITTNKTEYEHFLIKYYMRLLTLKENDYGYIISDIDIPLNLFIKYYLDYNNLIYCLGNTQTNSIDLAVKLIEEKHPITTKLQDIDLINYTRKDILASHKMALECQKHSLPFYDISQDKTLSFNHITHDISENYELKRTLTK